MSAPNCSPKARYRLVRKETRGTRESGEKGKWNRSRKVPRAQSQPSTLKKDVNAYVCANANTFMGVK